MRAQAGSSDFFVFSTALGVGNVDTIGDYSVAAGTVELKNAVFAAPNATGPLAASAFRANTTVLAGDSNDRIIYETDTGKLYCDAGGTGARGGIHVATPTGAPAMTAADFVVI